MEAVTSAAICHGLMKIYCGNQGNSLSSSPAWRRQTSGVVVPASFATFQQLASPAGSFPPALQALSGQQNICFLPSFFSSIFFIQCSKLEKTRTVIVFFLHQWSKHTDVCPGPGFQKRGSTSCRPVTAAGSPAAQRWGGRAECVCGIMPFLHFGAAPHHADFLPIATALRGDKKAAEDPPDEMGYLERGGPGSSSWLAPSHTLQSCP